MRERFSLIGSPNGISPWRLLLKSFLLILIINFSMPLLIPANIGKITLYNHLFPGRERLPFGEDPEHSYNMSILNLDAMFSSHEISGSKKAPDEYRVVMIGDSSVWGILLHPEETLSGVINEKQVIHCGLKVRAYNLAYPTISVTKDLLLLEHAKKYEPDLIVWPVTLEAFPLEKQLSSPIVSYNSPEILDLINLYDLPIKPDDPGIIQKTFIDDTLLGQRRSLADLIRLQLYGFMWAATGIDQVYPENYQPAQIDLNPDMDFHEFDRQILDEAQLAFHVIEAGMTASGNVPIMIVNEPILISNGENSELRYNFYYPRWAYDQYRILMTNIAKHERWKYLDLWDTVPIEMFTNSAIHLNYDGEVLFANQLIEFMAGIPCQ